MKLVVTLPYEFTAIYQLTIALLRKAHKVILNEGLYTDKCCKPYKIVKMDCDIGNK